MRFFFFIVIMTSFLWSVEVEIQKNIKISDNLWKRFSFYWKMRGKKDFSHIYNLELPYLQYLHSKTWYKNFFINAPIISKVKVHKLVKCTSNSCILGIKVYIKNKKYPIYLFDKWIKINNMWYHKYNDASLPTLY